MAAICTVKDKAGCSRWGGERCAVYDDSGVAFRNRMGSCPFANVPAVKKPEAKKRVGQQKQKKDKT